MNFIESFKNKTMAAPRVVPIKGISIPTATVLINTYPFCMIIHALSPVFLSLLYHIPAPGKQCRNNFRINKISSFSGFSVSFRKGRQKKA